MRWSVVVLVFIVAHCVAPAGVTGSDEPRHISGIYPHLAMFNDEAECGTGAVVPWAGRLWVITYGPHLPYGSSDRLYEITPDLQQIIRPESVGGTHANRMIHRESQQLVIGPYFIDADRNVRVVAPRFMPGRLTGNARHLTDPAGKVYFGTMEEGLYEVDVASLAVTGLIRDGNSPKPGQTAEILPASVSSKLPGYHGKGLYSGQGRAIYANNGDHDPRVMTDPTVPSGALAQWFGQPGEDWQLVRRNQFTEVTGPGGIAGAASPATDPVWSIGWDARSLILMVLDGGQWSAYRLPKGSHSYDGAHGWNTEWPRIRDIGEDSLLMTMHGTFWRFPRTFSARNSAGIAPRSNYLKVIGDFARWDDRLVCGCDDTAKSEFLNKRRAKGEIVGPGRSQSNLWFVNLPQLDQFGPALGRGAVWLNDPVTAGRPSDPYLFSGYSQRTLHLRHAAAVPVTFTLEVDPLGNGQWEALRDVIVPPRGYTWIEFPPDQQGTWIRATPGADTPGVTAFFHYRNPDQRSPSASSIFDGLAQPGDADVTGGLLYARGADFRTLRCVAREPSGELGCYDMGADLNLVRTDDPQGAAWTRQAVAIPRDVLTVDEASVLYVDDKGRWRLPKGDAAFDDAGPLGEARVCREVCTERDLFNAHGTFYELPAENAGGVAKMRPVATHGCRIHDYASYRGLLVLSGLKRAAAGEHIIRANDGRCALWVGVVDDLWQLGKPRGTGGPWKNTPVKAGVPSDPYLMTGYDHKQVTLSHASAEPVRLRIEADITGTGQWVTYDEFSVEPGQSIVHTFPDAYTAYWVRVVADRDTVATATFVYE